MSFLRKMFSGSVTEDDPRQFVIEAMLGAMEERGLFSGATAFASPCTSPYWFGVPGLAAKLSISLFSRNPAPLTVTLLPYPELSVVVTATAL